MHVLMHMLSHPAAASATVSATDGRSAASRSVDGSELLESVQRMVDGNGEAFVSLTPHLYSCAGLAGAFVDTVGELERNRELAAR